MLSRRTPEWLAVLRVAVLTARRWLRAFRRTRPFWGGTWLMLGGLVVVHFASSPLGMALAGGWSSSAGYILGGAMVVFGALAWFTPDYAPMVGLLGVGAALAAFVGANLGGFLIGTLLGILGGSMIWGWGEKPTPAWPRRPITRRVTERVTLRLGRRRARGSA